MKKGNEIFSNFNHRIAHAFHAYFKIKTHKNAYYLLFKNLVALQQ